MKATLKRYALFGSIVVFDLILVPFNRTIAQQSAVNSIRFAWGVLLIVPAVMVLMGLFDVWVPREVVERNVGPHSGVRGAALTMLLGTAAAGPLYAAFPIAGSLQRKGARLANIVIFLGTWASIKIPMILLESSFVGIRFALLRLGLTIPGVLLMGFLMEWMGAPLTIPPSAIPPEVAGESPHASLLPSEQKTHSFRPHMS